MRPFLTKEISAQDFNYWLNEGLKIAPQLEYNQFIRDFFADPNNQEKNVKMRLMPGTILRNFLRATNTRLVISPFKFFYEILFDFQQDEMIVCLRNAPQ